LDPCCFFSCESPENKSAQDEQERNKEAREDSVKLALATYQRSKITNVIQAIGETEPVGTGKEEDAADDPAIWYNQSTPENNVVFGTNKKGGIYAYDLSGEELDYYPLGEINNIDVRHDIPIADSLIDVLGGSNRSDNSLLLYQIDDSGKLKSLFTENLVIDTTDLDEVYGFCLYKGIEDSLYAIINGQNGRINSYVLVGSPEGINLEKRHVWETGSQPEGMVADDEHGILYVGEEEKGIWRIHLRGNERSDEIKLLKDSHKKNNPAIEYDIEGLAIHCGEGGEGFLLASIQGSFSYALFDRNGNNRYLGSFVIDGQDELDNVEETDGLDIFSKPLGPDFPGGLLVVQDGFNYDIGTLKSQNFKYVDLEHVIELWNQLKEPDPVTGSALK
jgi:3-phytase